MEEILYGKVIYGIAKELGVDRWLVITETVGHWGLSVPAVFTTQLEAELYIIEKKRESEND